MGVSYEQYEDAIYVLDCINGGLLEDTRFNRNCCELIILMYENSFTI